MQPVLLGKEIEGRCVPAAHRLPVERDEVPQLLGPDRGGDLDPGSLCLADDAPVMCVHAGEELLGISSLETPSDRMADPLDLPAATGRSLVLASRMETREPRGNSVLPPPAAVSLEE